MESNEKMINILHENGFIIGIHTNGYTPETLRKVIDKIDYKKQLKEEEKTVASYSRTKRK